MKTAICPGSFDPVTNGHVDIIRRAASIFDKVTVVVMPNFSKTEAVFSKEERACFLNIALRDIKNVEIDFFDGLLAEYAAMKNIPIVVKGLRAMSDFEYEFQMSLTNQTLNPDLETVFLTTSSKNMYLSSSLVKQVAFWGGDISAFVPESIASEILKRFNKEGKNP